MFVRGRDYCFGVETCNKGNSTEAAVLQALVGRGIPCLVPFGEGHSYDLVAEVSPGFFLRIQCKTGRIRKGCLRFNSRSTDHGRGPGTYLGLADAFGVCCLETRTIYIVPVGEVPRFDVFLRLDTPKNNQRRRVRFASDYEFDQWTNEDLRALATAETGRRSGQGELRPVSLVPG